MFRLSKIEICDVLPNVMNVYTVYIRLCKYLSFLQATLHRALFTQRFIPIDLICPSNKHAFFLYCKYFQPYVVRKIVFSYFRILDFTSVFELINEP